MVRNVKGFTMVELMIVIAIIGVLAVALIPTLLGNQTKARDTTRTAQLKTISSALDGYQLENNKFPNSASGAYVAGSSFCVSDAGGKFTFRTTVESDAVLKYIKGGLAPVSPGSATQNTNSLCAGTNPSYGYRNMRSTAADSDEQLSYMLVARMEGVEKGNIPSITSSMTGASAAAVNAAAYRGTVTSTGTHYALFY